IFDSAAWARYQPRDGDIVIGTFPKCGTTWTQRIVSMLLAGGAEPAPVAGPWPDFRLGPPLEVTLATAEAIEGRRHLKTHLPYDSLPLYEGVKFIHVARDGRDSALSYHNHLRGFQPTVWDVIDGISRADPKFGGDAPRPAENPGVFFREWLKDGGASGDPGASYWELEPSYWAARREPHMLLVHYNDLKADRAAEIGRIARFLEIDLAPAVLAEIVEAADFDAMKSDGEKLMPNAERAWVAGSQTFLHKGVNGRWRGLFDQADLAAYEAKVAEAFTPGLAAWLEGGRLIAGDPAQAPD
ncbi:MAG: sulfotransferase domain-containing protein, partial [Caulobacteraceae bacterium]